MNSFLQNFSILFILVCCTLHVSAQSPTISIQGTLKDASGASVSDGNYTVEFRLYHTATGGTIQWSEEAMVDVTGGIYSHYLGSVNPFISGIFEQTLYLGVSVADYELTPRAEMTYAPYTLASYSVSCSGAVGDVKYSILNPTEFAAVNGSCWVPLDGSDMSGSALSEIIGNSTLPDMSGLFMRAAEYNEGNDPDRTTTSPIASVQNDELKSHNHEKGNLVNSSIEDSWLKTFRQSNDDLEDNEYAYPPRDGWSADVRGKFSNTGTDRDAVYLENDILDQTATITGEVANFGGAETRPSNMNFYIYIRIN